MMFLIFLDLVNIGLHYVSPTKGKLQNQPNFRAWYVEAAVGIITGRKVETCFLWKASNWTS